MKLNAGFWARVHMTLAIAWIFPGILVGYYIVYRIEDPKAAAFAILLVSLYANTVSHWGAWQAARAEGEAAEASDKAQ